MIASFCFGQLDSINCIQLGKIKKIPMLNAEANKCEAQVRNGYILILKSISDSLFSLCDGKVIFVSSDYNGNDPPDYTVIIQDSLRRYVLIGGMQPKFKKDDSITRGDLLGFAGKVYNEDRYFLLLMVINGTIKDSPPLTVDQIWQLIKDE